jgi:hypothetical protein
MDVNSNRLKLKLDMVYRDLAPEEAQKRFAEFLPPAAEVDGQPLRRSKRKTVKASLPK